MMRSHPTSDHLPTFHHPMIVAIVLSITFMSIFACDLYIPSLPSIGVFFSATESMTQLTIALYFLGLSGAQLLYGTASDRFGRKPVLLLGLSIAFLGSIVCLLATSMSILLLGRFIQGVGAAAGFGVARAVYSDLYQGEKLSRVGSYIGLVISLAPAIAPTLGGYLQGEFGWQSNFVVLTLGFLAVTIIAAGFLPETHVNLNPHALKVNILKQTFRYLLTHPVYLAASITSSVALSGVISYYMLSAYLYQDILGITPFGNGLLTIAIAAGFGIGYAVNIILIKKMGTSKMVTLGSMLMLMGSFMMLACAYTMDLNVYTLLLPMMLYVIGGSCIHANSTAIAIGTARHIAGAAAAVFGTLQMVITFLVSGLASVLPNENAISLSLLLCVTAFLALWASKTLHS